MEVAQAAHDVLAERLPLARLDGHAVLVLEEAGALRGLPVHAVARALPLLPHLAHRVVDQGGLGQRVAVAQRLQCALDGLVHDAPGPHVPGAELLQHIEGTDGRVGAGIPAAPGPVVVQVIAPAALLKDVVPCAGPGELIGEIGHGPQHSRAPRRVGRD